ncbi:MAG: prolipoprotein diacylglyceryl transferase [Desulfobulbaceae bacterium]|jgi:phosphatidylglycerol:prolipoprotein diacylglycerol transferase|nr:prolipoprotein diacylglyceryl transferase [Desulfobulbaceae bacterium]MDY0351042.1 prolipoprotein diacylglyceryl transferase [Desulfobulbaceae bacterium]
MLPYPDIDPVLIAFGPFKVRWYGLMYVLGFAATYFLVRRQLARFRWREMAERFDNLNLYLIIGVIAGGRLGYVLFYQPAYYLRHPLEIFATWQGGMSFHGGCLGVIVAGLLYCRYHRLSFWKAADLYVVTVPIGLGLGRIGNFINGELFGRTSDVPWAMVFPDGGPLPRHPSQLYEALLEGALLFCILWSLKHIPWRDEPSRFWPHGSMLALFLILYGVVRIVAEFFREPDPYLGFVVQGITMGQLLSIIMIAAGLVLWRLRLGKS